MIRLNELLASIHIASDDTTPIHSITVHDQDARENVLFVAVRGTQFDSNRCLGEVMAKGAKAIGNVEMSGVVYVADSLAVLGTLAHCFYGYPARYMYVIGVSGTNGKSSVTSYIAQMLRMLGEKVCLIGGEGIFFGDEVWTSDNTTPSALQLAHVLHTCVRKGITYCVMEVSSHALVQQRTQGILYDMVVLLNLGHDHLDYHPSLYQYEQAKAMLLQAAKPHATAVYNCDDAHICAMMEEATLHSISYGLRVCDRSIRDIVLKKNQSAFYFDGKYLEIPLLSLMNVYNSAAACSVIQQIRPNADIASLAKRLLPVAGRLEMIYAMDYTVIIDYAHTVEAFKELGSFISSLPKRASILVMGLGGNRDQQKRAVIGEIVAGYFDILYFTSDNPRDEDPLHIIRQMCERINGKTVQVEINRVIAIQKAIAQAKNGDIIVIAGKGDEGQQIVLGERVSLHDKSEAYKAMEMRNGYGI